MPSMYYEKPRLSSPPLRNVHFICTAVWLIQAKCVALVMTKYRTGVHRLDNSMSVQPYSWSKQSVCATSLDISTARHSIWRTKSWKMRLKVNNLCKSKKGCVSFICTKRKFVIFIQHLQYPQVVRLHEILSIANFHYMYYNVVKNTKNGNLHICNVFCLPRDKWKIESC